MFSPRSTWAIAVGAAAVLVVAGCATSAGPSSTPPPTGPTTTAPPSDPEFSADGDARDNLDYFDFVMGALLAEAPDPDGRTIVDHLVDSGFDKAAMEVTADVTAVGGPVDAIVVAVRFGPADSGATCIIGQTGSVGYHSLVAPALDTGRCLVGLTRAIDW